MCRRVARAASRSFRLSLRGDGARLMNNRWACRGDLNQEDKARRLSRCRDEPSNDQVETERPLLLGAHNPLIRRYFSGLVRFDKMALVDARNLTHGTISI